MTQPAIDISGLTKVFRVYNRPKDMLLEVLTGKPRYRSFTALDNVNLSIDKGSVVGILGKNGAGKSTLLKIVAGTLASTSGDVMVNGRISAILELGTGFNPNFTGRDNIYMGGLCLGLSRKEIEKREADIIAFSELGEFIDQPFRTYSSGMQARLTFSVAVCVNPDILIVDEALSVGDARFQRKCFRKFEEFREAGCTILFVTHQTGIAEAICDRAVYMAQGKIVMDGPPKEVVAQYMKDIYGTEQTATRSYAAQPDHMNLQELRYGTGEASIISCGVWDKEGKATSTLISGSSYTLYCDVKCNADEIADLNVGISITTKDGIRLLASNPIVHRSPIPSMKREDVVRVTLDFEMNLGIGDYFVTFGAWGLYADKHYDRRVDVLHLAVQGDACLAQSIVNMKPRYASRLLKSGDSP